MKPQKFDRNGLYEIKTWKVCALNILSAGFYEYIWIYRTHKRLSRIKHLEFSPGIFAYAFPWLGWHLFWRVHALEFGRAHAFRYVFILFYLVYLLGSLSARIALIYLYLPGVLAMTSVFAVQNILMNNIIRRRGGAVIHEPKMSRWEYVAASLGILVWTLIIFHALTTPNF